MRIISSSMQKTGTAVRGGTEEDADYAVGADLSTKGFRRGSSKGKGKKMAHVRKGMEQAAVQLGDGATAAALPPKKKPRRDVEAVELPPLLQLPSTNTSLISSRASGSQSSTNGITTHLIETVIFSGFEIQAWYPSPYPIEDVPIASTSSSSAYTIASSSSSHLNPTTGLSSGSNVVTISKSRKAAAASISPERGTPGATGDMMTVKGKEKERQKTRLFVCDGCFKYTLHPSVSVAHKKSCTITRPPGIKVYERGDHAIWEVDGATDKLYCQNLSLFGKMFIDHKYVFFDVEGFKFYVLTKGLPSFDYVLGFFSKEKVSYDNYNLACIMTFPPYQRKGYGALLIEFSYELSRRSPSTRQAGTPERPLSDLGTRGYLNYWIGVLVRYFRSVFEARAIFSLDVIESSTSLSRNSAKPNLDGGAEGAACFEYATSLVDVARATNLRPDDVAFALIDCGLAQWRRTVSIDEDGDAKKEVSMIAVEEENVNTLDEGAGGSSRMNCAAVIDESATSAGMDVEVLVITSEAVEEVARSKAVKEKPWLDLSFVLL